MVVIISLARFVSNNCTHRLAKKEKENASAKDGEREGNGISKLNYALSLVVCHLTLANVALVSVVTKWLQYWASLQHPRFAKFIIVYLYFLVPRTEQT